MFNNDFKLNLKIKILPGGCKTFHWDENPLKLNQNHFDPRWKWNVIKPASTAGFYRGKALKKCAYSCTHSNKIAHAAMFVWSSDSANSWGHTWVFLWEGWCLHACMFALRGFLENSFVASTKVFQRMRVYLLLLKEAYVHSVLHSSICSNS